ncbi:MAG TPA: MBL fold metallo-hydrolase [Xanthobacteraceae bacterium]|nr:MBL fold metallo-hydrolase [Xanthobacteraceae bacterium]
MASAGTKLVLLGTKGGPRVGKGRANPANAVVVNGRPYVVDCGYGVTRQLIEAGIAPQTVRDILITHHHSDHILELGPLIYNIWVGGLREAIDVWGPPPLHEIVGGFFRSMAYDMDIRIADEGRADLRQLVRLHEFDAAGVLFEHDSVRVSAAKVHHPPLPHAYAFRFDAADRAIVLSGDTAPCRGIVEIARGADVLLHEVMHRDGIERLAARMPNIARLREHLIAAHTTTEQVGKTAAEAGAKLLVLNHFVPGDDETITEAMWLEGPRRHFAGPVIAGRDLQVI